MFGMLRLVFTVLICVLIIGFYLGWFSFHRGQPDPQSNKVDINVSVDEKKMGTDLQTLEHNVAKRIQDINNQPPGNGQAPPSGQQPVAPRLNFGPISLQPSGQPVPSTNGQPATPGWPVGPVIVQPADPPQARPWPDPLPPPGFAHRLSSSPLTRRKFACRRRTISLVCRWWHHPRGKEDNDLRRRI